MPLPGAELKPCASSRLTSDAEPSLPNAGPESPVTTTSEPSTAPNTGGLFSSPEASRVNQRVEPGSKRARQMTAGSGRRLSACLEKSTPLGRFSRILLELETWGSPEYLLKWKVSATKCGCSVFRLVPLERRTDGRDIGSWPTVVAQPANGEPEDFLRRKRESVARGSNMGICLSDLNMVLKATWPTPQEHDETGPRGKNNTMSDSHYFPHDLATVATVWPTPAAQNAERGTTDPMSREGHNLNLQEADFGTMQSGSLAQTENFVVRLMILSAWLMGYQWSYLKSWPRKHKRKLKGSDPCSQTHD